MANIIQSLLFKRGLEAKRNTFTPRQGEPVFTTDNKELFIGDGTTQGGIPVGTVKTSGNVAENMIALFKDATGKVLYGITKTDLFKGYATEQFVTGAITNDVPNVTVKNALSADSAKDSVALKGRSDYLTPEVVTDAYDEGTAGKLVSAVGIKSLFTTLNSAITNLVNSKVNKTDVTSDLTSSSTTKVSSAAAVKVVNDKLSATTGTANAALQKVNKVTLDVAAAKASGDAAQSIANEAKVAAANNKAHLNNLPQKIQRGTSQPSGGSDGDVYLLYK